MATYTYPEDRTGTASSNFIPAETQTITFNNTADYHFVAPKFAPFYRDSVRVYRVNNGARTPLERGKDFYFGLEFTGATLSTTRPIYGAIVFMRVTDDIELEIDYQTLGGQWTLDEQAMAVAIANIVKNPSSVTWEQVANLPTMFNPTDHLWDYEHLRGQEGVIDALDRIALAIRDKASNPAAPAPTVTKETIGLGKVPNQGNANLMQILDPDNDNSFVTPKMLHYLLEQSGLLGLGELANEMRAHLEDKENPHNVNKINVELSEVENLSVATTEELISNASVRKLITLDQLIRWNGLYGCGTQDNNLVGYPPLGALLGSRCNDLTKDKVGLYADGKGGTYEAIMEASSRDCGYQSTVPVAHPPSGTVLSEYCSNGALINLVADGYGGVTPRVAEAQSNKCGANNFPAAGTVIDSRCEGSTKITTIATGNGGTRIEKVEKSSDCEQTAYPPNGVLKSTKCSPHGKDLIGIYHDGTGGTYEAVMERNSIDCGYVAQTPAPEQTYEPRGTFKYSKCDGSTLLNVLADGRGGTYTEVKAMFSKECGYVAPSPVPVPSPGPTTAPTPTPTSGPSFRIGTANFSTTMTTIRPGDDERQTTTGSGWDANADLIVELWLDSEVIRPYNNGQSTMRTMRESVRADGNGNVTFRNKGGNGVDGNGNQIAPAGRYASWAVIRYAARESSSRRSNEIMRTFL